MEGPREYQLTMASPERREEEIIMEPLQTLAGEELLLLWFPPG